MLSQAEAFREAEELVTQSAILYPTGGLLRTAFRGAVAYQLSWYDAYIWASAEHYGLAELYSEDLSMAVCTAPCGRQPRSMLLRGRVGRRMLRRSHLEPRVKMPQP